MVIAREMAQREGEEATEEEAKKRKESSCLRPTPYWRHFRFLLTPLLLGLFLRFWFRISLSSLTTTHHSARHIESNRITMASSSSMMMRSMRRVGSSYLRAASVVTLRTQPQAQVQPQRHSDSKTRSSQQQQQSTTATTATTATAATTQQRSSPAMMSSWSASSLPRSVACAINVAPLVRVAPRYVVRLPRCDTRRGSNALAPSVRLDDASQTSATHVCRADDGACRYALASATMRRCVGDTIYSFDHARTEDDDGG